MERITGKKVTVGLLFVILLVSLFFSAGVFAAAVEVNSDATVGNVVETDATTTAVTSVMGVDYRGHIQDIGNYPKNEVVWVHGPDQLGTTGEFKRIEGFWIKLTGGTAIPEGASIRYNVHIENEGWQNNPDNLTDTSKWKANGEFAGSTAKSQRIEAIEIVLVGADGKPLPGYSVKYQVHGENYGWTQGWKADGQLAGTTGESLRLEAIQIKIEQAAATAYDKAGTYGPATGTEVVDNNVTVDADGVTLQNLHIKGDLTISEKVGDGTVNLNNVTVDGQTYVRGGGEHSIHINGGSYNNIVVEKTASGNVRIVATDATGATVVVSEDAKGQDIILEGEFDSVDIKAPDVKVSTQGDTKIGEMNVAPEATGSEITLDKKTTVDKLAVNAPVEMKGEGTVQQADVNSNGVSFEQKPVEETVSPEVTEPPIVTPPTPETPVTPPSGGGGGETTTTPVSAVEVINEGNLLSARIAPVAATVRYQWQRCDTATGTFTDIAGATTDTYTRGAADGGKFIKVRATGTGSYSSSVTSLAMTPVSIVTRDPDNIGGTGANFDATTNSFTGSIDYYNADSKLGGTAGNRVGVKIKAPAGVNVDTSQATVSYVNYTGGRTPLALNGPDYVYFYPQVTMAGQKYTCFIDWDGSETTYGTEIVSVHVESGSILKPGVNVPVTITAAKAAGATGSNATTTVKYSLDSAAAAVTGTTYTAPVYVPVESTIYFFAKSVDGGSNSSGKSFVYAGKYQTPAENSSGYTVNIMRDDYMASAAAPTFSIAAGAVELGSTVTLTSAEAEHIFYTTDGTDPVYWMVTDSNGEVPTPQGTTKEYTSAIAVDKAMTIKAVAMKKTAPDSEIVSAMYTLTSTSQTLAAFAPTITATPSAQALSVAVSYPGTVAASIKDYTIDSQITIPDAFVGKELSFTISGISDPITYSPQSTTFSLADVNKMSPYQTTLDQNKGQSWTASVAVPEGIPGGTYPVTIAALVKATAQATPVKIAETTAEVQYAAVVPQVTATKVPTSDGNGNGITNIGRYAVADVTSANGVYETTITANLNLLNNVTSLSQGDADWVGVLITTDQDVTNLAVKTSPNGSFANLIEADVTEAQTCGADVNDKKTFVLWLKAVDLTADKEIFIKEKNEVDATAVKLVVKYSITDIASALKQFAPTIVATQTAQALSVAVSYPDTVADSIKNYTIDSQITIPDAFVGKELSFTISGISDPITYSPQSTTFSLADVNKMSPYQTTLDLNKGQSWTVSVTVPAGILEGTYPATIESLVKNGTGDPFVITKTNTTVTV